MDLRAKSIAIKIDQIGRNIARSQNGHIGIFHLGFPAQFTHRLGAPSFVGSPAQEHAGAIRRLAHGRKMNRVPLAGDFVLVRSRRWLVEGALDIGGLRALRLACIDDDAQGESVSVLWDAELDASILVDEGWAAVSRQGVDDPGVFAAYLRTLRWNTATAADRDLFQAPFRAGIHQDTYQLLPLRKALHLRSIATTRPCVVYTAITGGRDELKEPLFVPPDWRFVCFTDSSEIRSQIWEIRPVAWSSPDGDPRRTARWHKVNAHMLFPEVDVSIWADASVQVSGDWRTLLWYLGFFGLASYKHYMRDCLYEEAMECIRLGETTILLRRHNEPKVVEFAKLWRNEICFGSKRDQISANYVAWRIGLRYAFVRDTLRSSAWLLRHRLRLGYRH